MNIPIFVNGVWRMDWGYGNPNLTGALIATMLAGVWIVAFMHRRGFWLALVLFSGLLVCLIHTMSRGGLLGALGGLGMLVLLLPRPWPKGRTLAVIGAIWMGVFAVIWLKSYERLGQGVKIEDRSITNRLLVWQSAPKMLADAPWGWGINRVGEAYMEWYQPLDRSEEYGSLVNTHLTKIVEFGVLGGVIYLMVWGIGFLLAWPVPQARWLVVPFAVLASFFISSTFTSMGRNPTLWILPAGAFLIALIARFKMQHLPARREVVLVASVSTLLIGGLYGTGFFSSGMQLHGGWNTAKVGKGKPAICVVVDKKTIGKRPGRSLREYYQNGSNYSPVMLLVGSVIPKDFAGKLIITGEQKSEKFLGNANAEIVVLNPKFGPAFFNEGLNIKAYFGEYSESREKHGWGEAGNVSILQGVGDYVANWPSVLLDGMEVK